MAAAALAPGPDQPEKLVVRSATQDGLQDHQQLHQQLHQQRLDSRQLSSQSGSRFGQLSHSSFFARHNPHPHRCTYIRGLLGLLIPVVVDDNECHGPESHRAPLPVNAININSQRHPIDTINGLQYFTNLRNFSFREKAVPRLGLVPITENWREQLRSITEQTFQPLADMSHQHREVQLVRESTCPEPRSPSKQAPRPLYSQQTGRLLPPPSRAMSRKPRSRRGATPQAGMQQFEHISPSPDLEAAVFSMLCQILQTEDYNAVQAWLVSASDKEKSIVIDMIRSAVSHREAYYEASPSGRGVADAGKTPVNIREDLRLPPIQEKRDGEHAKVDRLVIEDNTDDIQQHKQQKQQQQSSKKPAVAKGLGKQQQQQQQQQQQKQQRRPMKAGNKQKPPTMKFSKAEPNMHAAAGGQNVWRPQESYT